MSVIYRAVEKHEQAEAMRLWTSVFNMDSWFFQSTLDAEQSRQLHQTLVAVEDDKIVAAVHYFIRLTRGADGSVHKLGGIGNVATYEEARKKGHSGELLKMAIDLMAKDGCLWSMLFTGVNPHYERYGWKTLKTRYRQGLLNDRHETLDEWRVMPVNLASDKNSLERIEAVYNAYNETRPLTNIRTEHYWKTAVLPRIQNESTVTYTACLGDCRKASAYAIAQTNDEALVVKEVGVLPGCEESLLAVMDVVRELAVHRGVNKVRAHMPYEKVADAALNRLVKNPETGYHGHAMALPLTSDMTFEQIQELFLSERAIIWPVDDF